MLKIVQDSTKFSRAHWTCFTKQELILEEPVFPWVLKLCLRCSGVSCLIIMLQLNNPSQSKGLACSYDEEWSFKQPGTNLCIPPAWLIPTLPLAPCESGCCWNPASVAEPCALRKEGTRARKTCRPPEDTMWLERGRHSAVDTRSKFRTIFHQNQRRRGKCSYPFCHRIAHIRVQNISV